MSTGSRVSAPVTSSSVSFVRGRVFARGCVRSLCRNAVWLLDWILRAGLGIYKFSENSECLLRIAIARAGSRPSLPEGICLGRCDRVVELHFWNEHFAPLLNGKAPCTKARLICRHLESSMRLLAGYLLAHPEIDATMIHGRVVLPLGDRFAKFRKIAEAYGFRVTIPTRSGIVCLHDLFEDFLVRALRWAFNPGPARRRRFRFQRADLWIDRTALAERYVSGEAGAKQEETALALSVD